MRGGEETLRFLKRKCYAYIKKIWVQLFKHSAKCNCQCFIASFSNPPSQKTSRNRLRGTEEDIGFGDLHQQPSTESRRQKAIFFSSIFVQKIEDLTVTAVPCKNRNKKHTTKFLHCNPTPKLFPLQGR